MKPASRPLTLLLLAFPLASIAAVAACTNDTSSTTPAASSPADGGPGPSQDGPGDDTSPCAPGSGALYIDVTSKDPSGGDIAAIADCSPDAGAIPALDTAGDCRLYSSNAGWDITDATETYIPHGEVRVTQASSSLDVTVGSKLGHVPFTETLAPGEDVTIDVLGNAAIGAAKLTLTPAKQVTVDEPSDDGPVQRSAGLQVVFSGGTPDGKVSVRLTGKDGQRIRCGASGEKGIVVVASTLLNKLAAGAAKLQVTSESSGSSPAANSVSATVSVTAANGERTLQLQ